MTDDLDALEQELARLRPLAPSSRLATELADRLTAETAADAALERELATMVPVAPTPALRRRIAEPQGAAHSRRQRLLVPCLLAAIVAAAAALVMTLPQTPPATVVPQPVVAAKPLPPTPAVNQAPSPVNALAFADPRTRAMLAAGYRPVALEQAVVDTIVLEPNADHLDQREVLVHIRQSIRWHHQLTGVLVDTKQTHEAVIQEQLALY